MTLEDLYRLLRSSHVQAQGVVDTITQPLLVLDSSLCVVSANPAFYSTFHADRDDTVGANFKELGNGQWNIPNLLKLIAEVVPKATAVIGYQVTHTFEAIGQRTMLVSVRRLVHPDNRSTFMLVVFEDITERAEKQSGQDLVLGEVEHRLRNFFGVVSAIANQTPSEGQSTKEYQHEFARRLEALIKAELFLFNHDGADLASFIETVQGSFSERVEIDGQPPLNLAIKQMRPLGMIIHELTTNAAKYGALSTPSGTVTIRWAVNGQQKKTLRLEWLETDGPAVTVPSHNGFGSRLIKLSAEADLRGHADIEFAKEGLKATIEFPVAMTID